jgi:tyrosine-protein phosphatase SIW14
MSGVGNSLRFRQLISEGAPMIYNRRVSRAFAATLFVAALAIPAAGQTRIGPAAPQTRIGPDLSHVHIDNFGKINANYYRGAQPAGHDYADLAALGVKTVIDFTQDGDASEPSIVKSLGMNFYRIPMTTREVPTKDQLEQFLKLVNDPASQPVYVHCQGGRHRTGVMTAVYRMTNDGWSSDQAFGEMKHYKYGADFLHPEFKQFFYAFKATSAPTKSVVAFSLQN